MNRFLYFVILLAFQMNAQESDEIKNMVKNQIEINLSKIPANKENSFGFNSRNDFKNCKVGDPLRVITLSNFLQFKKIVLILKL
jgi:ABC-type transporter MlaC component